MKKKMIILFPAIYTVILSLLTILVPSPLDSKGLIAISLVVLFPLLILIQSMMGTVNDINVCLPLATSILVTMSYYSAIYLISGIVGYVIGKIICKFKASKKVVKEVY